MNNRNAAATPDLPSADLVRARRLIAISFGFWLFIGILAAAAQDTGLA